MKKFLILAAALSFALAGCKEKEPEKVYDPINMSEFGFKVENNPVLNADIVVAPDAANAVNITLPYGISSDDIKALVPVFVLSEEDGVAKIDDKEILSGKTAVDFTNPVDIVISTEHVNALYSVTVSVQKPLAFAKYAESSVQIYADPEMAVNPETNVPHFVTNINAESSSGRFPYMFYLNGTSVDSYYSGPLTEARSDVFAIGFDDEGEAYASFSDWSSTAVKSQNTTVMQVSKSAVKVLGSQGTIAKANNSCGTALFPISSSEVWSVTSANAAGSVIGRRAMNLSKFDGSAWTQELTCGTRSTTEYTYGTVGKLIDGERYVLVIDYNSISLSLYKYDKTSKAWIDYPGAIKPVAADGATEITTAETMYGCIDFDVASNGDVYVALCADLFTAGTKQYGVFKYSPDTKKITVIGGGPLTNFTHGSSGTGCRYVSVALDANDVPYVVLGNTFRFKEVDGTKNYDPAVISYIDADTKMWTNPQPISDAVQTAGIQIAFAGDGTGYVSYKDESTSKIVVYKTISE